MTETDNIAKGIFEFKAGYHALTLLPKAAQQLVFNRHGAVKGAFNLKDSKKNIKFKTSNSTDQIIVIYNNDESFLPIFVDPKYESYMKIKMALNQMTEDDMDLIEETLDNVHQVIDNFNIVVVNKENLKVDLLNENELYFKFYQYYHDFKSQKTFLNKLSFLLQKMEQEKDLFTAIQKREIILKSIPENSYQKFYDEFKSCNPNSKETLEQRTASVIRKALASERARCKNKICKFNKSLKSIKEIRDKKLAKSPKENHFKIISDYKKGYYNLNKQIEKEMQKPKPIRILKNEFNHILQMTVEYNGSQLNFKELDYIIYSILYKDQKEKSKIGIDFELMVEQSKELQEKICSMARLKFDTESQLFFTHTHGISDIDMALV
jgi:hypothetical protein